MKCTMKGRISETGVNILFQLTIEFLSRRNILEEFGAFTLQMSFSISLDVK